MKSKIIGKIIGKIVNVIIFIVLFLLIYNYSKVLGVLVILCCFVFMAYLKRSTIYSIMGNKQFAKGDIDKTSLFYRKALAVKNCKPRIRTSFGYLLLKSARLKEAEEVLGVFENKKLLSQDKAQYKMTYALLKWKSGNLQEAISILEEVYNTFKCTTVFESLGYLLILNGDFEKALEYNLEAYEYNDSNNVIVDNLGETYYYLKFYDKAYDLYEALLKRNPNFPEPYYYYGLVLAEKGKNEEAISILNKALTFKESFLSNLTHAKIENELDKITKQE